LAAFSLFLAFGPLPALGQVNYATPFTFTTLAGNTGYGSADGVGSAAGFADPTGVGVDSAGNIYVGDDINNTIRKVTPGGVVTTLAGLPTSPGSADGIGSAARFNNPQGVTADPAGNVYAADTGNHTIRKLTLSGTNWVVTTFAGQAGNPGSSDGTGTNAQFNSPSGVATDGAGNVYVADTANDTIRIITPAGAVTTLAGLSGNSGSDDGPGISALFKSPTSVAVDAATNLYVADWGNDTIRQMTLSEGVWNVTTIAGDAGYQGSADGPGTEASFAAPYGVAADSAGNIYVADTGNDTIRKIAPAGTNWVVTTLAGVAGIIGSSDGTGSGGEFNYPSGLAVNQTGDIYVADSSNGEIRKMTPAGSKWAVTTLAGQVTGGSGSQDGTGGGALFNYPYGVAVDRSGNVYVADTYNDTIRQVTPQGLVTTLAGLPGVSGGLDGTGISAQFYYPTALAADKSGNIYVADSYNDTIRKMTLVDNEWVVTTLAGQTGDYGSGDGLADQAYFADPFGVAVGGEGNIYVADTGNDSIRKISLAGTNWMVATLAGNTDNPGAADGTGTNAMFNAPMGVAVDGAGNLFVADTGNATIRKVTPAGVVTTVAGAPGVTGFADGPGESALFNFPSSVAVDDAGGVYVADTYNAALRKLTLAGTNWVVTTVAGINGTYGGADGNGRAAQFYYPSGVAVDGDGFLYVADTYNNVIRQGFPPVWVETIASSPGISGGHFGFLLNGPGLTGAAGASVVVDASPDLANWTPIWTNALTFPSSLTFTDPSSPSLPARFYRARTQ
jgi:hypothetical protein